MMEKVLFVLGVALLCSGAMGWGSSNKDRVLLADVKAITLESGKMTTGRRSSPVPQLSCVGGTAGCYGNKQPRTVQCLNRGSDGSDAQWECKASLDNDYQFGRIQVTCEGYDYPDDPYILKGSCGLEYELDYTEQGRQGNSYHGGHRDSYREPRSSSGFSGLIQVIIVVAIIYFLCSCMRGPRHGVQQGVPASGYGDTSYGTGTGTGGGGGGGPGFWTGAATGGALGYLFGNRGNTGYGYGGGYGGNSWGSGWGSRGSGWGSGGGGWSSGGSRRSSGGSSSSRTTSGFGGTSRR